MLAWSSVLSLELAASLGAQPVSAPASRRQLAVNAKPCGPTPFRLQAVYQTARTHRTRKYVDERRGTREADGRDPANTRVRRGKAATGFLNRVRWFDSGRGIGPRGRFGSQIGPLRRASSDGLERPPSTSRLPRSPGSSSPVRSLAHPMQHRSGLAVKAIVGADLRLVATSARATRQASRRSSPGSASGSAGRCRRGS